VTKNIKLFIATTAFEGKNHIQYTIALSDTIKYLADNGIVTNLAITTSGSLLVAERNRLCKMFLKTDCTHILCIDSDLGWPPLAVHKMLEHDEDIVGGLYPFRAGDKNFIFRPFYDETKGIQKHASKFLLKMQYIPAGFMLIKRHVLEKVIDVFPQIYFQPIDESIKNEDGYLFFNTEIWNGEFWCEDYVFCRRLRDAGFEIYIDPLIQFDHAGTRGMFINMLTNLYENNRYFCSFGGAYNSIFTSTDTYTYNSSTQFQVPLDNSSSISQQSIASFPSSLYIRAT
jgi:hypothetical protein